MATTNDLKNGLVLNIDGQLWTVVEFQHVKPGKGGAFDQLAGGAVRAADVGAGAQCGAASLLSR